MSLEEKFFQCFEHPHGKVYDQGCAPKERESFFLDIFLENWDLVKRFERK